MLPERVFPLLEQETYQQT